MKAVRFVEVGKPLELQEVPAPVVGAGDVLVKVKAAGICHSDAHYRAGISPVYPAPLTLGHEVAGIVERVGGGVRKLQAGDRVVLHYLVTCGQCEYCSRGAEQFCPSGKMLGHYTDGGYAEYITVPERNALRLPEEISFEAGATLMCASATAFHALRKSRLAAGERLAVFGIGGLGFSAIQLGKAAGALEVYAVDIQPAKLDRARRYGAIPIDARQGAVAKRIREMSGGAGVEAALELVGSADTMEQAVRSLAPLGRAVVAGLTRETMSVNAYQELIGPEAEIIGSNDHLLSELPLLIELARRKVLNLDEVVSRTIPLEADIINAALDDLEQFKGDVRTVISL